MLLNLFNHSQSHNRNYGCMFFATMVMVISCLSCNENTPVKQKTTDVDALPQKGTYGYDVLFLKKYHPPQYWTHKTGCCKFDNPPKPWLRERIF